MDVLVEEANGLPILIRSQLAVDFPYIEEQIRKRPEANIVHSHLHASVIASRSRFFITNWITTTLADARSAGIPTIEFTDYNDRLKQKFSGNSCCPDWVTHFVNNDQVKLRETIRQLLYGEEQVSPLPTDYDDVDVIKTLTSGRCWRVPLKSDGKQRLLEKASSNENFPNHAN